MRVPWLVALFLLLAQAAPARAAESEAVQSPRAIATLVADTDAPAPGKPFRLGLRLRMAPGWHTYWKNPGDAGVAPEFSLVLPTDARAGEIAWPVPARLPEGDIMTYGYTGDVVLPITVTLGAQAGLIEARANWLICEKICVPEEGVFRLILPGGDGAPAAEAPSFAAADRALPRPFAGMARIGADGTLLVQAPELTGARVTDAWFFPDAPGLIEHSKPQGLSTEMDGLRLRLVPGVDFKPGASLAGVLEVVDRGGQRSHFSLVAAPGSGAQAGLPFAQAILFAFLGGLILNLMPCVFPVLAMKAVALSGLADQARGTARAGAAFYTLGVLTAFTMLAGALVAARQAGAAVGWGFQFQSPVFVAVMAWLLFAVGLNLSGVFQLGGRLAGAGQGMVARGGWFGNFATGLLAAVVATPCTAPFMGAAIAVALAASVPVMVAVFLAMGLGLAAPFVALATVPALARWLPRPGAWMDVLKQVLAFPMYAASAWMVWVLSQAMGPGGVLVALSGLLLVGFAGWALGLGQMRGGGRLARGAAGLAMLGALALLPGLAAQGVNGPVPAAEAGVEIFSPTRLAALRAAGKPVFVNMTAAWCITCLVNERIALAPASVRAAFADQGIIYLKGDWTRQDKDITAFLRAHERDGVPLYVFYSPGREGMVLPQILTEGTVLAAIAAK